MQESPDNSCGEPPPVNPSVTRCTSIDSDAHISLNNARYIFRSITNNSSVAVTLASSTLSQLDLDKITHESKLCTKSTQSVITVHDGLTGSRAAVIDDTGPTIPEVNLELFFAKVLPCPPIAEETFSIFESLSAGSDPSYADGRWVAFPDDPAKTKEYEAVVFSRLERVAEAIVGQAQLVYSAETLTRFRNDPDLVPESKWRGTSCRPDSFFVLRRRRSAAVAHWADIAATGEFKRKDGSLRNLEDDSKKVLWNMHQTLRDDPCRRFTFGFTIENRTMRIWFCSRAEILVSEPFDFISEPLYLVRFFLAFTFAQEHELGWDPTMKFVSSPKSHYIITARSPLGKKIRFKTEELLSSSGAEAIRGRATRVWKVRQWIGGRAIGPLMVLKDCWIDFDRPCEGDVLAAIRSSAKSKPGHRKVLDHGLLTTFTHGIVHITDGVVDATLSDREDLLRDDKWYLVHRSDEFMKTFDQCTKSAAGADKEFPGAHRGLHDHLSNSVLKPITYHSKKHYRIVFLEICTTFADEKFLSGALHMLSGACTILKSLHAVGWVHRDISAGNVMVDTSTGAVKLADLEYAKKIGRPSGTKHHEMRTGTLGFMSIEVAAMRFLFLSKKITLNLKWFYTPIHDMESVWWLFAWTTLNRDVYFVHHPPEFQHDAAVPSSSVGVVTRSRRKQLNVTLSRPQAQHLGDAIEADEDQIVPAGLAQETRAERVRRIKKQHAFSSQLFIGDKTGLPRNDALREMNYIGVNVVTNKPLHPVVHILGIHLCTARDLLTNTYTKAEADIARLPARATKAADGLYDQFRTLFDKANEYINGLGVRVAVRRLSDEHKKILDAEKLAKDEAKAAGAADAARRREEGLYRLFLSAKDRNKDGSKDVSQPSSTRAAGPSEKRPRKPVHTLPSVTEDPEVDPGSGNRPGTSTLLPSRTMRVTLPSVLEEEENAMSGQPQAGPSRKGKQVHHDGVEAAVAGPSRPTRASARTKPAVTTGPSTKPALRKSSRRTPARAVEAALPSPPPKRKRAAPSAPVLFPAPSRGRPSRARAAENAHAPDTAQAEELEEAPRPSKKRRVETEAKLNPTPGGRVLRSRKR